MTKTASGTDTSMVPLHCKTLHLPTVARQFQAMAQQALQENKSHVQYLEVLLETEVEERERHAIQRRIQEAKFPRVKTLDEFDFSKTPHLPAAKIRQLAEGGYIQRSEPVVFIGDCGTGKTHLLTALGVAACKQKRRVRFTTAANMINELIEAQRENQLQRALARWGRYEILAIDEVGYVPFVETGAELLFQVIADRAEKAAILLTTNLPFSEWTQVFPNPRLCKALLDRITDQAHIIETGQESYRFKRTLEQRQKKKI
ncbi:MAG TPA: IS21-like element helper ATPase IstB [Candidatus Ozemobacteraceae bacterium]|nr:IS21-like element helper ATPase IstB [Candidatus Ozemobacteraceae bacterium]